MDQSTQRNIIYGCIAIAAGFAAYQVYTSMSASASPQSSSSGSRATPPAKTADYTPQGDPETWSEDDMKKFLISRNLAVGRGSNPSKTELLAMVESKLHEPTSTGFDDPQEWSAEDMKEYLKAHNMAIGHDPSRMELLAMVEASMHAPK